MITLANFGGRSVELADCHEIVTLNRIKQAKISKLQKTETLVI